jgi:histidinol phosphatase-like PHP family hydrolase
MSGVVRPEVDVNAAVARYLRELAFVQSSRQKTFGYKRAAAAIAALETPLTDFIQAGGEPTTIHGIGPASARVIREFLERSTSPSVERAIDESGRREDIERRRALSHHFLSRAEVLRILRNPPRNALRREDYRGDLQMHSEWSDGNATLSEIRRACQKRGYEYAAITDHSHGLRIAGGMSMEEAAAQRKAIVKANARPSGGCRLLQGIEANIRPDGQLDLSDPEARTFEIVLAAPHSQLRKGDDQTARMITAVENPAVRILAHPRGRMSGSRRGVLARWDEVFARAARLGVAIEIDGDPARQDLDYTLARRAWDAGCLFALDSDAHTTGQLVYAETAMAHAILAGIKRDRVVNCWPLSRLLAWLAEPASEARR